MNKILAEFLVAEKRPPHTKNYPELNGFLFAIACSPEKISVTAWMMFVFNNSDPKYNNEDEKKLIEEGILAELHKIEGRILNKEPVLAGYFKPSEIMLENFDEDSPIAYWGRGFLDAIESLQPMWDAYLPEKMKPEINTLCKSLSFFANKKQAEIECGLQNIENLSLDVYAETVLANFDYAATSYANIGLELRAEVIAQRKKTNHQE